MIHTSAPDFLERAIKLIGDLFYCQVNKYGTKSLDGPCCQNPIRYVPSFFLAARLRLASFGSEIKGR